MLQHKIAAQILLILSIFNIVIAAPVVREIHETHDDEVVPVVVRNVEVMSEERRGSESEGPTPSDSSTPLPDGSTLSHSSPPLPDGSTPLFTSSPSDEPASLNERPTRPVAGGPASGSLAVSSPPGEMVPATDEPVPIHSTLMPQDNAVAVDDVPVAEPPSLEAQHAARMQRVRTFMKASIAVGAVLVVGNWLWFFRHNLHHRAIEPDGTCY